MFPAIEQTKRTTVRRSSVDASCSAEFGVSATVEKK